jgi:hypothetical protein
MAEFEACSMKECPSRARGAKHAHVAGTQRPKLRVVPPVASNYQAREYALKAYIDSIPANLLRAYLIDHITDAHPHEVDKFVVLLRATGAVPAKEAL